MKGNSNIFKPGALVLHIFVSEWPMETKSLKIGPVDCPQIPNSNFRGRDQIQTKLI